MTHVNFTTSGVALTDTQQGRRDNHPNTGTEFADMDKNRVRQLLALWAVVLAGMAAFAAVVLLHLQNNAF